MLSKQTVVLTLLGFLGIWRPVCSQVFRPNTDAGILGGASYYLGDINPRDQYYRPALSFGATLKHNFTEHHALRINAYYGSMKGDDLDFPNAYQQTRAASFETSLVECHAGYEFNFLPYIINRRKLSHTPFIFAGVGYSIVLSSTASVADNHLTIPFGVGYKYRLTEAISIGCEWGMRKTFIDTIDGVLNPGLDDSYSAIHNNDWYSFGVIFVTFRVFEKRLSCPAVKEQTSYR